MNKKILLLISTMITSSPVIAAIKISYSEAIDLAVKKNLEVQASYEIYKSSLADKKSVRSAFMPKLSASLSYDKTHNEAASGTSSTSDSYAGSLNLSQNLFNGFQDQANLEMADSKVLTEEANLQETKAQISYDLKTAIATYVYAKDSLTLSRDIKKRREDNLRMVELRFENGRENKGSVLLSKAYLEQAKLDLMRAENAMEVSRTFLVRVLNLNQDEVIELTDLPPVLEAGTTPNYDSLIENTPSAKKYKASLTSAKASLESSKSNFYPSWDLNASTGKTGSDFFPDDNKKWSVGTSLTWSLFSGGADFYSANSASLIYKASEKKLENQNKELVRTLKESYTGFAEANSNVKVSNAFLEAAKVRADISRSKYNNGLSNFDDWDLIENDLINKQKDYTAKVRDRLIAEAAWERSQGTGVIP